MLYKKQQMYHGNQSQLLEIFNPTPYLTSTLKKDVLILDFSEIMNSQAAVTNAKFSDGIFKFVKMVKIGKNDPSGKSVRPVIARFTTFRHRTMFYGARKNLSKNGVHLDLTKTPTLKEFKELIWVKICKPKLDLYRCFFFRLLFVGQ